VVALDTTISGVIPPSEIDKPLGVSHRAIVTFSDVSLVIGISSCTEPLPKEIVGDAEPRDDNAHVVDQGEAGEQHKDVEGRLGGDRGAALEAADPTGR